MKTLISTVQELKDIILEILFTKTDKVSKVSNTSILNALAYGNAKVGQRALKDIALIESQLFPEYATGEYLDAVAARYGIFTRLGSNPSTTYMYLYGKPGTVYYKTDTSFASSDGISFILEEEQTTIPNCMYTYAKVRSEENGEKTNVPPLSIISCINPPVGHNFCINEFMAVGGRNVETDEELLYRIKNIHNVLATKTLDYLAQIALRFNSNILKFVNLGTHLGRTRLGIYTQSGASLTEQELIDLKINMINYLALSDISDNINSRVIFENVSYNPIDLNFQISYMEDRYSVNEIYRLIQKKLVDYLDFRYWDINKKVYWSDLYSIVKDTEGVLSVPYANFKINGGQNDIDVKANLLPRFRSCLIYDLNGSTLLNTGIVTNMFPVIYPTYLDTNFNVYFNEK